jgi:hypothetical protein
MNLMGKSRAQRACRRMRNEVFDVEMLEGWGALLHNVRLHLVAHQHRRFDEWLGRKDAKVCGAQGTSLKITPQITRIQAAQLST